MIATTVTGVGARDAAGRQLVGAYALQRADGSLALLLVNRDLARSHVVALAVRSRRGAAPRAAHEIIDVTELSAADYEWRANGPHGYPSPDGPPPTSSASSARIVLAAGAIAVLRTRGAR
jgi:hypothetical protein